MHAVLTSEHLASTAAPAHDLVVILDEAGSLSGQALGRAAALLDRRPDVGTVFVTDADAPDAVQDGARWLRAAAARGPDSLGSRRAVLRRTTFEVLGPLDLGTRHDQLALWLRAAAAAGVAQVAEPLSLVSLTTSRAAARVGQITELHERAHAFRNLFEEFEPARNRAGLKAAARRAIVRSARRRALVAAYEGDSVEASLCRHLARDVQRWGR